MNNPPCPHHHHLPSQHSVQPKWTPRNTDLQFLPTWKQLLPMWKQPQYPRNIHPAPAESSKCARQRPPIRRKKVVKNKKKEKKESSWLTQNHCLQRWQSSSQQARWMSSPAEFSVRGRTQSTHLQRWWWTLGGRSAARALQHRSDTTDTSGIYVMTHVLRLSAFNVTTMNTHMEICHERSMLMVRPDQKTQGIGGHTQACTHTDMCVSTHTNMHVYTCHMDIYV